MGAAIHAAESCPQICLALPFNARGSQLQKCLLTLESCAQQPPASKRAILNMSSPQWSLWSVSGLVVTCISLVAPRTHDVRVHFRPVCQHIVFLPWLLLLGVCR